MTFTDIALHHVGGIMRGSIFGFICAMAGSALLATAPASAQTRADSLAVARAVIDMFSEQYVLAGFKAPERHVFPTTYYMMRARSASSVDSWPGLRASVPPERVQAGDSMPECSHADGGALTAKPPVWLADGTVTIDVVNGCLAYRSTDQAGIKQYASYWSEVRYTLTTQNNIWTVVKSELLARH